MRQIIFDCSQKTFTQIKNKKKKTGKVVLQKQKECLIRVKSSLLKGNGFVVFYTIIFGFVLAGDAVGQADTHTQKIVVIIK